MTDESPALHRAMHVYLAWKANPAREPVTEFLNANEELRHVLEPMLERNPTLKVDAPGPHPTRDDADAQPERIGPHGDFSHYHIIEQIGAGGMGEVYRARDRKLDREVALKILPADFAAMPQARERFLRESRLAAQLSHPNIATVFDADEVAGQLYYAMELVSGDTLQVQVRPGGLPPSQLLDLAIPLAEGIAEAHRVGIVHRDLKPGNVMLDVNGRLRILDFGLSRQYGNGPDSSIDLTRSMQVLGTPQYMSPEQVRGQTLDARSDLFSLGTIFYELATGTQPFFGSTLGEVMEAVLSAEPPPIQRANPRINDELARVVVQLLEKDRNKRMQTADDLLVALRAIRDGRENKAKSSRAWWIAAVAVATPATVLFFALPPTGGSPAEFKRIAVLPFESRGATDEVFAEGFTDAITARLACIHGLRVISRRSSKNYKNSDKTSREIGEELGVRYIVEGTVLREQGRVHVIPRLIRAADDTQKWSATFQQDMTKVFEVQSEIAEKIARELDVILLASARRALANRPTESVEAYDLFLRGNEYRGRGGEWSEPVLDTAIEQYGRAIALDSGFSLAYAQRARCLTEKFYYWHRHDADQQFLSAASSDLDQARVLASDHPLVQLATGQYYYYGLLDYDRALSHFEKARLSAPSDSEAILYIAFVLRRQGKWQQSVRESQLAMDLDPRNVEIAFTLGTSYWLMREYDKADYWHGRATELAPEFAKLHAIKANQALYGEGDTRKARAILDAAARSVADPQEPLFALTSIQVALWAGQRERALREIAALDADAIELSRHFVPRSLLRAQVSGLAVDFEAAREIVEKYLAVNRNVANLHSTLGIALAGLGRKEEAIRAGERAVELQPIAKDAWMGTLRETDLAHIHAVVGEPGAAIDLLEKLLAQPGELGPESLPIDPRWLNLREHPRFQALMKQIRRKR